MIDLQQMSRISDVEARLAALQAELHPTLRIQDSIRQSGIGGESALLQFLLTWARRNPTGKLYTSVPLGGAAQEDYEIGHLVRRAFGFVAILVAKDVLAIDGRTSLRAKANRFCSDRVDKMARGLEVAAFGHRTFLACVDHSTKAFIPAFYFSDGTFRNRSEFYRLAEDLLTSQAGHFTRNRISRDTLTGLGLILYELVKNTHDWGRKSIEDVDLNPSVRGILLTRFSITMDAALRSAGANESLKKYVGSLARRSKDTYIRFLELSVFDGGPGLAARSLGKPIGPTVSIDDELAACFSCLRKHQTSSGDSHRGLGLFDVMRTLGELHAYLRLRSGRLALYRDFIHSPLQQQERSQGPSLFDWETSLEQPSKLAPATGTLFTIIIPLIEETA